MVWTTIDIENLHYIREHPAFCLAAVQPLYRDGSQVVLHITARLLPYLQPDNWLRVDKFLCRAQKWDSTELQLLFDRQVKHSKIVDPYLKIV